MNAPERLFLPDVQAAADHRALAIDNVGVRGIRYPLTIARRDGTPLTTVAEVAMSVSLPARLRGAHMSRFLEVLEGMQGPVAFDSLGTLLRRMLDRLEAEAGRIVMRFPFFMAKRAPISGVQSLMDYDVTYTAEARDSRSVFTVQVLVPVTSLCPCSKEISRYGAHNQRSHVTITATMAEAVAPEDLIAVAEAMASCDLYGLLKRPDEKYVTERAYENPKFVEDMVRDVALTLERDERILAYRVESENFESIHNHSAYACIERDPRIENA